MAKKPISQKRAERQQAENAIFSKVLYAFLIGMVAEFYLYIAYRSYIMGPVDSVLLWDKLLRWGIIFGFVVLAGSIVVAIIRRKLWKTAAIIGGIGLFLGVSSTILVEYFKEGAMALFIVIPALTVLALIYFLYQHECFLGTMAIAGAMLFVWGGAVLSPAMAAIAAALAVALLAAVAFLVRKVEKRNGKWKKLQLFSTNCNYRVIYGSLSVSAVGVALSLLVSGYYLLWTLGIGLFALLVYYTTKLM